MINFSTDSGKIDKPMHNTSRDHNNFLNVPGPENDDYDDEDDDEIYYKKASPKVTNL